ncbi:MAG: CPBP family intramembrane glutamic endopeptidase [Arachnia sp.]
MSTTTRPTSRTRRPYLILVAITVGLVLLLGVVGTASYILGFTGYAPLVAAYIPLAVVIAIILTVRHAWVSVGFRPVRTHNAGAVAAMVLAALLPISVLAGAQGLSTSAVGVLGFAGMAILVGFVEEAIFRGILPRVFASRGTVETVVVTSIAFAVAHAVTALSPDQSMGATLRTIGFAFLFGVVASMLVRITGSIWPAVVLHATFDLAGFVLTPRSALVTDGISIALAAVVAVALILIARRAH